MEKLLEQILEELKESNSLQRFIIDRTQGIRFMGNTTGCFMQTGMETYKEWLKNNICLK